MNKTIMSSWSIMKHWLTTAFLVAMVAFLFTGCVSNVKFTIKDPVVSNFKYDKGSEKPLVLQVIDQRSSLLFHDKIGGLDSKNIIITLVNISDPIAWLSQSLEKEFAARNIPVQVVYGKTINPADIVLTVRKFQIVSRRMSAYSPWESYHSFRGEVTSGGKIADIRAYFFNGKVPMWSIEDVVEPCFNMPLSLLVKEIASKINHIALNYSAGDEIIRNSSARAAEQTKNKDDYACFPIFELGGSNNPAAIISLTVFADNDDRFIRACALSAIGTLGGQNQLEFLQKKYKQGDEIDKYMALKSIGDFGTPQAMDSVLKAKNDPLYDKEVAFKYLVDLYLEK